MTTSTLSPREPAPDSLGDQIDAAAVIYGDLVQACSFDDRVERMRLGRAWAQIVWLISSAGLYDLPPLTQTPADVTEIDIAIFASEAARSAVYAAFDANASSPPAADTDLHPTLWHQIAAAVSDYGHACSVNDPKSDEKYGGVLDLLTGARLHKRAPASPDTTSPMPGSRT